ncbi:MAG: PQQ-binding-like beta-propeller repeat protein [Planctomycetes bacterium]|nr:PQQ-binding-like beta-propeller repeat protein [Planctomycetota bacterium]
MTTQFTRIRAILSATVLLGIATVSANITGVAFAAEDLAQEILERSGIKGGLVVHVGCGDGKLTAALRAGDSYLVHGLDADAENVRTAREHIRSLGLYGKVSVDLLRDGRLPYIDNVVNLIVIRDAGHGIQDEEILRVLAPEGVALRISTDTRNPTPDNCVRKPRPNDIDEWTHYLHDASNNVVAHDDRVGPPRHLQWQCGPRWSRHHDHMASVSGMVSTGGRVFYILDEGSRVSPQLPSDWKLVGRDAFNGVLLWKRSIDRWHDRLWPLKSGPANLPRRLVAEGQVVYATLGIQAPVSALDAASGETQREYANTAGAEEIVLKDGVLLVLVNRTPVDLAADLAEDPEEGKSRDSRTTYSTQMAQIWAGVRSKRWTNSDRVIRAFDAESGRQLWEKPSRVIPLTLAADSDNAYYHNGEKIVAINLPTGDDVWTSEPVPVWHGLDGRGTQSWFAPTLVAYDGKVLFAGGEKMHMSYMGWGSDDIGQDTMSAFEAKTGEKLWTAKHPYSGYNSPEDLFVAGGSVWNGVTGKGNADGRYTGHNLRTGEIEKDYPPTVDTFWFHHRCYRAKATDKYVLCSRTGIEFVDIETGEWTINHWVRGGCLYGIMPCNGLIYSPPHPCACYPEAKLYGFTALAAKREVGNSKLETRNLESRLQTGPAVGAVSGQRSAISEEEWPTYRHDAARSGAAAASIAGKLRVEWTAQLGGRLTQPVVGGGCLFVADVESHTVYAIDVVSGEKLWSYIGGGKIDSPPTYDRGRLLFGSADGHVYCLRASDGALAWRFRAAPVDQRMVAFDQVESVWPVHGSVLVQDGVATVVAGRSMYLDGGLRVCRIDAETGRLLSEKVLDDRDPESGENMQTRVKGLNMPVALTDILSSDGECLYMRSQVMDLQGNRLQFGPGKSGRDHLFAAYGFTDDSWFHRTYWLYGDGYSGGVGGFGNARSKPAGRILVNNDQSVFGYGRKPDYFRWSSIADYHLFAAAKPGGDAGAAKAVYFKNSESLDPSGRPLTVAAWIKTDSPNGTVLVRGAQQNGFALVLTGGKPRMLLRTKGTTYDAVAEKPIGSDWTHVAGVLHEDGRMVVYLDGKAVATAENVPMLTGEPSIPMKVGYDDTNQLLPKPLTPFSGALDEVMLFHRALAAEEIQRLADVEAKLTKESRERQVLHLSFSGGKARDRSSCANHGEIAGGKVETVEGPFGEALVLKQPKRLVAATGGRGKSSVAYLWTRDIPVMVRAMALAGDTLVVAGPPDVLDEDAAFQAFTDESTQEQVARQDAALKGQSGAILQTVDAKTGETLAEHQLESPPVFDGLIVAGGRVFIATTDGHVVCLGQE